MITVEHLTKYYGDVPAVEDLSFTIERGHVYGFLGPNGAGKTTTMNIMTGCLSATEGHVRIDGYDIFQNAKEAKKRIGYLPEQPPLYLNETPQEYLRFVGEAKGLRGAELREQIDRAMAMTRLHPVRNRCISALSKGYKQRVGIAQALLGDPEVIIMDEPTVGLDPIQIVEIRDLIGELGQEHTVILSSHILSEVQAMCEEILIISKGKLIAFDTPENLERQLLAPNVITLTVEGQEAAARLPLAGIEHITDVQVLPGEAGYTVLQLKTDEQEIYRLSRAVFFAYAAAGTALVEMTLKKANLEDIFLELTEDGAAPAGEQPAEQSEQPLAAEQPTEEREEADG